jgi:O-antigen/teichoic acid export membrane protein
MEEFNLEEIKSKTTASVLFLSLRNIGIQFIAFLGFFLLTKYLKVAEIGLFGIVVEIIGILAYFSDIGLAAALIQQKEPVSKEELRTTFLIQQSMVIIGLIIFFILNKNNFHQYPYLILAFCFSFICASLKTIPSVLLERNLNFKILSTIDVIENLLFYIIAVIFAILGFGINSYVYAIIVRSLVGLIWIYYASPWPIGFAFSISSLKKLFKFGIPFQLNSFIAMLKDRVPNVLVYSIIGKESFGLLTWAQKGPRTPLSFMDAIQRITFPTFARMQDKKEILTASIKKSIFFIGLFIFPALAGIALISPNIVHIIPKYLKWEPAILPLYFYCVSFAIAAITTPLTNAFNAVGKITITTGLMIMWTVLTWIFFPILSKQYGYIGTSYAALIVGSSSVVVWIIAKKIFDLNVLRVIFHPLIASILMVFLLLPLNIIIPNYLINLILKLTIGILFYLFYLLIFCKKDIDWFIKELKCYLRKK